MLYYHKIATINRSMCGQRLEKQYEMQLTDIY